MLLKDIFPGQDDASANGRKIYGLLELPFWFVVRLCFFNRDMMQRDWVVHV